MGWYINPKDGSSKEEWLDKNSEFAQYYPPSTHYEKDGDLVVVCLVENPGFTAAAICVDQHELQSFIIDPSDMRPKLWYHVPRELLIPFLYGKQIEGAPNYGEPNVREEPSPGQDESPSTTIPDSEGDNPSVA